MEHKGGMKLNYNIDKVHYENDNRDKDEIRIRAQKEKNNK